ncbi:hypothetical protein MUK42_09069, partial [Musa troglodytarum]
SLESEGSLLSGGGEGVSPRPWWIIPRPIATFTLLSSTRCPRFVAPLLPPHV